MDKQHPHRLVEVVLAQVKTMANTYKVEEKAGIGTDQNLSDTTGWTVHGTNLSATATEAKIRSLTDGGSNPIDIRVLRDDGCVDLYSFPTTNDKIHVDGA